MSKEPEYIKGRFGVLSVGYGGAEAWRVVEIVTKDGQYVGLPGLWDCREGAEQFAQKMADDQKA